VTSQSPDSSPEEVLEDVLAEVIEDVQGDSVTEVEVPNVLDVSLKGLLEAILMVVDEPASEIMLAQISERPLHEVVAVLKDLAAEYETSEREVAGGWRFYTRAEYAPWVERFVLDGQQARLTQASLETLAVVAYRQPVSRARVSAIRGVNVDGVMRTLISRGLVEEDGTEHETGAHLYRTTSYFLERIGLSSLEQLPELAPHLPDLGALEEEIGSQVD
jgi:segregation and condensation protein B